MADALTADMVESKKSEHGWASRIVGYGEEQPDQLLAHPENWRIHTKRQRSALTELLDRVGWVQNVVVNQRTGHVLDGHLRVGEAISRGERMVPVTYVDLNKEEERLVLASLDPIASLAQTDSSSLMGLLSGIEVEGELEQLLRSTANMSDAVGSNVTADAIARREDDLENAIRNRTDEANSNIVEIECPHCGEPFGVDRSVLGQAK